MKSDDVAIEKMRKSPILILILVVIIILTLILGYLLLSHIMGESPIAAIFSPRLAEITAEEFNFDIGRARMFTTTGSSIAAAGTLGIKVLGPDGVETLRDSFRMGQPAIASAGNYCIAFDIGGSAVRVFNNTQVTAALETSGTVVSASINQNGWYCVVTQDGGGYRGVITVYNNYGADVFKAYIGSGFVLSAALSHDNKSLAILSFTETGSRITFYDEIDSNDEPEYRFDYSGGFIVEISYLPDGNVLAFSADLLFTVNSNGENNILYSYHDNRLGAYDYDKDFIALHLYDFGVGYQGRLITALTDGTILGETVIEREVISISAVDKSLVVLRNDGITFYNEELEEFEMSAGAFSAAGASRILAVRKNIALATSDNSAVILRREEH